jgi:DNA-binding LacI/PurR family transcriptional regulator
MPKVKEPQKWSPAARQWLAEKIREALYNSLDRGILVRERSQPGTLLEAVLGCWTRDEPALRTADANEYLQVNFPKSQIPPVANLLRKRIRRLAEQESFAEFEIDFPTRAYRLTVKGPPPLALRKKFPKAVIGLSFPHSGDWFFGKLVGGAIAACEKHGYSLVVKCSEDSPDLEAKHIIELIETTEGTLIVPVSERFDPDVIERIDVNPVVLVDRYITGVDVPCVRGDDRTGGRLAAEYLKRKRRCKRVLVVFQSPRIGRHRVSPLADRLAGCRDVYGENAIEVDVQGRDEEGGYKALEIFHKQREKNRGPITAEDGVFALTDKLALGCRRFLAKRKIPVKPENVVGYEGQEFGRYLTPQLVSVKLDDFEMGRLAAEILIKTIKAKEKNISARARHHLVPVALSLEVGIAKRKSSR